MNEDYYNILKSTLTKQKLAPKTLLKLEPDFYKKIIKYIKQQDHSIQEIMKGLMLKLYRLRNTIIIQYAVSSNPKKDYSSYFSSEEYAFFKAIQYANQKLRTELRL